MNAALQPVAAEIAGLPGAPVRAEQVASGSGVRSSQGLRLAGAAVTGITGTPPVYNISSEDPIAPLWGNGAMMAISGWGAGFAQEFLTAYVAPPNTFMPSPAQQAVVTALMAAIGAGAPQFPQADNSNGTPVGPSQAQIGAAATRFEALSPAARRAWLATHLVWLHLRSRRVPTAVLAMAVCALVLRAALHWQWMFTSGSLAQQLPMILNGGAVVAVVVTTHSPFGEAERATGRWLPYLRLGAALALTGLAIGVLQLGVTGASLNGGVLVLARNVVGLTGTGLLCAPVMGGLLAWTLPVCYLAFAEYALLQSWGKASRGSAE